MTEPTIVHLVPHTHWDREWYQPFQTFRMRLVELVDQLLERMAVDDRLRFTLDGQAATVDDYLEVRPEAEPLIRRLIAERRLAIGPWQILLDEFLVSGETIVRNLELGWQRAEELGGAMPLGYLPDMFGHIAQMPQILRRAGIERAAVWRGVPASITQHTFGWSAPDGSRVETEYLVGGYGNGAYLFDVPDRLAAKLTDYCALNAEFYGERSVLAMYGTDHAVPSPRLADLIDQVNHANEDVRVRLETLADYVERGGAPMGGGQEWAGEMRSGARANMLMNVTSARIDLKAAAARAERVLERYAEPLTAIHGDGWPTRLLEIAWRKVIDNSAHDSICGCSHDEVVAQVISRYAEAEQIASGIVRATVGRIGQQVPAGGWAVFNPSPVDRDDLVELDVAVPPAWESVAVRLGDRVITTQETGRPDPTVAAFRLRGSEVRDLFGRRRHGRELFGRQINGALAETVGHGDDGVPRITISVDDAPDPPELDIEELLGDVVAAAEAQGDSVWEIVIRAADRRRLVASVRVPALGWAWAREVDGAEVEPEPILHPVQVDDDRLDNGLVAVEVARDGSFRMVGGGSELVGVGRIVDGGDAGDSYNYGPPAGDALVDRPSRVERRVIDRGPVRGELEIARRYDWPVGLTADATARSATTVRTDVTVRLELRVDEPFVRVRLHIANASRDHRVRWHIPLTTAVQVSAAEGQFAVVERGLTMEGGHGEVPLPTYPAHAFVSVEGLSVLLDQVTEYELLDDGGELALTVLRSFGLISRNANPYREDPAGPELPVPVAQLLGEQTFRFALYPHSGTWDRSDTAAMAERYRHSFVTIRGAGTALPAGDTDAPRIGGRDGLRIEGAGVALSALRRRGDWLELRLVNASAATSLGVIHRSVAEAREVDLLGRTLAGPGAAPLQILPDRVTVTMGAWEIRTIQLRVADRAQAPLISQR